MRAWGVAVAVVAAGCDRGSPPPGYQGVVEFDERVLGFEVAGRIREVTVERGDAVTRGQLLAMLDDTQAQATVAVREGEREVAQQQATLVKSAARREDIAATEAELRAARATEALAAKRVTDDRYLVSRDAIPQATLDDTVDAHASAVAKRQALEQRLRELRAGGRREEVAGARAQASAATAALERETDRAAQFRLYAAVDGEVLDVHADPGEIVGPGAPVITVGDITHPYVDVFVPVREIGGVEVRQPAQVRVDAQPFVFRGEVEHVARFTEFTPRFVFSERERANLVIRVRVRVADPGHQLHAGVPAFVVIER